MKMMPHGIQWLDKTLASSILPLSKPMKQWKKGGMEAMGEVISELTCFIADLLQVRLTAPVAIVTELRLFTEFWLNMLFQEVGNPASWNRAQLAGYAKIVIFIKNVNPLFFHCDCFTYVLYFCILQSWKLYKNNHHKIINWIYVYLDNKKHNIHLFKTNTVCIWQMPWCWLSKR